MTQEIATLTPFFAPRSVVVVGAGTSEHSIGRAIYENLLFAYSGNRDRAQGFPGPVYGVNSHGGELFGACLYTGIGELPEPADLAVIAIPPAAVPRAIEDVGKAGTRAAVVITAGFGELGAEGRALQDQLTEIAGRHGVRIIGPNCLGVQRPSARLNASFAAALPTEGQLALLSQSGAVITALNARAVASGIGLSATISLGSKADIDDADLLRWLAQDPQTRAIALYVESVRRPGEFVAALQEATAAKPVVAIKAGVTSAGATAAKGHTGAMAGSATAYSAVFQSCGVEQARDFGEFIAWSQALALQPPAAGKRVAILTNGGGLGVLAADVCATLPGVELAKLTPSTLAALDGVLPRTWPRANPVDIIGDAGPQRFIAALDVLASAPEVDAIVVLVIVGAITDPNGTCQALVHAHKKIACRKPIAVAIPGYSGTSIERTLGSVGIPVFDTPEQAVSATAVLVRRGNFRPAAAPAVQSVTADVYPVAARQLVDTAVKAGQRALPFHEARALLESIGIPFNRAEFVRGHEDAAQGVARIGYPVALKAVCAQVLHKTEAGAVVTGIPDEGALLQAMRAMERTVKGRVPGAVIDGFVVEEMVCGTELIVGAVRDPEFGPMVMAGVGGIFVQALNDVVFRLAPLGIDESLSLVGSIRSQSLLNGARDTPKLDRLKFAKILAALGELLKAEARIAAVDINPVVITPHGPVAIDARVLLASEGQYPSL